MTVRLWAAFIVLFGRGSLCAQTLDPITAWASVAAYNLRVFPSQDTAPVGDSGIVYHRAGGVDLKLDIVTAGPETVVRPTVVYIHGGGWTILSKEARIFQLLPYLARGMNVVNVEYRLANTAPAPAAVEDCRCALRWVHRHAKEYGFDTSRIVVTGGSAGGHLALMTGMLDTKAGFDDACVYGLGDDEFEVAAIVNFYGITDVADVLDGPNRERWAVQWFAGVPNRAELARRVSPLTYAHKGLPPIITVHGTKDDIVPYDHAVRLHQALDRAGVPNQLVSVPGGGHGQRTFSDQENVRAQAAIFEFLAQHGIPTNAP